MTWWHYLLLVNIYLLLFYSFYIVLLRRETFFQLNRIYLISAALLSFFIPLIQSEWVKNLFITQRVQYTIYGSPMISFQYTPIRDSHITIGQVWLIVYLAGISFLLVRFIWQLMRLKRIVNEQQSSAPYSFFKKVSLGNDAAIHDLVAAHENAHAIQWHSADVLLIEAVMIINWFNPVVYFYRFAIKHIHEFIADQQVIKSGTNKADYALVLLSQTFDTPAHQLVNPFFNQSLLKRRILMLQKNNSNRAGLIKYGLSAPLFILMLILSSATVENSKTVRFFNKKTEQIFLKTATAEANNESNNKDILPGIKTSSSKLYSKDINRKVAFTNAPDTVPVKDNKVFSSVEQVPEFPGGITEFYNFLSKNIRYPDESRKKGIQGRVIISFIVEKDGTLTNFKINRGVQDDIDQEALRVLKLSPKWKPGIQNGRLVRVAYTVPISFSLADGKSSKPAENKTGAIKQNVSVQGITMNNTIVLAADTNTKKPKFNVQELSTKPLILVDGKEIDDLASINYDDIKSVNVIKDKSAILLYGPKANNGVIVVTTKKNQLKLSPVK